MPHDSVEFLRFLAQVDFTVKSMFHRFLSSTKIALKYLSKPHKCLDIAFAFEI